MRSYESVRSGAEIGYILHSKMRLYSIPKSKALRERALPVRYPKEAPHEGTSVSYMIDRSRAGRTGCAVGFTPVRPQNLVYAD